MTKRFFPILALGGLLFLSASAGGAQQKPLAGLSYSPSGVQTEDDFAQNTPTAKLRADLAPLAALTSHIRTYAMDHGLDQIVPIARSLGLTTSIGIWLGLDAAVNTAEIDRALAIIRKNPGAVDRVFVGNEVLTRNEMPVAALKAHIAKVKALLKDTGVAVGTAEPWNMWLEHPDLAEGADFIGVHIFPYWDGVPVAEAATYVARRHKELEAKFPGKKVVIAETGWPAAGPVYKGAIPSQAAQEQYLREFTRAAAAAHYDYYVCEAYDQPWKAARERSAVGAAWGIMDAGRRPKFDLR